jgi:uncharacterized membrane protein
MRFTNTITINRPSDQVFAYLADLENLPHWNYAIEETRQVSAGPVAVGSRFRQVRSVPTRREESLEVVELDPGRRLTVRGTLNTIPAELEYSIEPDAGTTRLRNTVDLAVHGPLALVSPLVARQIKASVAANLTVLKTILERGNG